MPTADDRFARLVASMVDMPGVTPPAPPGARRQFGSSTLKIDGRIFAMTTGHGDAIVLKLPPARVAALIAAGTGSPFAANRGRPMREWIALDPSADVNVLALATEAMRFVHGHRAG